MLIGWCVVYLWYWLYSKSDKSYSVCEGSTSSILQLISTDSDIETHYWWPIIGLILSINVFLCVWKLTGSDQCVLMIHSIVAVAEGNEVAVQYLSEYEK